ncbi:MAG: hypothetical protein KDA81_14555 [Planctomycetaceae bacterium]|nr:hypothetical protein [Planctomycetaceae bacterium]
MYRHGRRKESDAAGIRGPVHDDTVRTGWPVASGTQLLQLVTGRGCRFIDRHGRGEVRAWLGSYSAESAENSWVVRLPERRIPWILGFRLNF